MPMMMRHRPPGSLALRVLKDHLAMPMVQTPIDTAAGAATNGGRRPTVVAAPAAASPELSDRPRRRTFTARDKLRILAETDRAAKTGGISAALVHFREGARSDPSPEKLCNHA